MKAKIESEGMIAYLLNAHRRSVKDMGNKRSLNEKIKPLEERHWIYCFKYRLICLGFTAWRPMRGKQQKYFPKVEKKFPKEMERLFFFCCWTADPAGKTLGSNKGSETERKLSLHSPQINIFLTTSFTGTRSPVSKRLSLCRPSPLGGICSQPSCMGFF